MGWRDLLQKADESMVLPWTGGRSLRFRERSWSLTGSAPEEHGWYKFSVFGRTVKNPVIYDPNPECLEYQVRGYLIGDRLIKDGSKVDTDPKKIVDFSEKVHLLEYGLERFVRISAGRVCEDGPLIYISQEMPLGPENEVLSHYLDRKSSIDDVKGVTQALDAAFRMESWQRQETERRRAEVEKLRLEMEAKAALEKRRQEIREKLGDAVLRREVAKINFVDGATAALAVGGAEYLDSRQSRIKGEHVVTFRLNGRRYECTCDSDLRIIDSGICLQDHDTGVKGDHLLTLESLPSVINEAVALGKLVVYRHVDGNDYEDDYD